MNWLASFITSEIASEKSSEADHAADTDQANQDNAGLQKVTPTTGADDTGKAIDDSFKHL